jgi:hypothetical protein
MVTLPAVALLLVAPPLADDREEAEARHALDRLRSEGGYAMMPTAADQCEWSAAAGMVESLRRKDARAGFGTRDERKAAQNSGGLPLGARASGPAASALGERASFERAAGAPTENGGESRDSAIILNTAARSPMRWCRARPPARPPPNCLFLFGLLKPAHPINPVRAGRPSQRVPLSCQNIASNSSR